MLVIMAIALVPIYLIWLNAETILISLNQDSEVAHLASVYLRWLSLCLPAFAFNAVSRRYFQSQGLFSVFTRIAFIVAPFNLILNYLLVWGPESIRLGFIGAPISTSISFTLTSALSIVYGIFFAPQKTWHPITMAMFSNLGPLTQLGLAGIGPVALASQSILLTSSATIFQVAFSLSSATAIRIGHLLGEKNATHARLAAYASINMALIVAVFTSAVCMAFRHSWGYMFNDDQKVVKLVASVFPLIAFFQFVDAISAVTAAVLRATGRQSLGALLNMTAFYVFGLPIGIVLAFKCHLGLHGLWIGLATGLIYCAVVGTVICMRMDWKLEIRKVEERIAKESQSRERDSEGGLDSRA
ncbi:hypothetical protein H0H87_007273 [Tephrocybe sp. NHM501043]|nr:hypothetical protein H0H87_007273 [Tephrocybe sp. NHM501043]